MQSPNSNRNNVWKLLSVVGTIGIDLAVCMFAGYWLGVLLADWFGGSPLWIVGGIMAGFFTGVLGLVYILRSFLGGSK